jgi:hypothetical protein
MQLLVRGKPVTVSADRVKPAYILNEADCRNTTSNGNPATVPPSAMLYRCALHNDIDVCYIGMHYIMILTMLKEMSIV